MTAYLVTLVTIVTDAGECHVCRVCHRVESLLYSVPVLPQIQGMTIAWFVVLLLWPFFVTFLHEYFKAKGTNAATKEDIHGITDKIESAKAIYLEKLEAVKTDLASRSHFSKIRYEEELKIYKEVWPLLIELRNATLSLRPIIDTKLEPGETDVQRKEKRAEPFSKALQAFWAKVESNKPFYPQEIWEQLNKWSDLAWSEAVGYQMTDARQHREYWDDAIKNRDAILKQIDTICEAIRSRLNKFE